MKFPMLAGLALAAVAACSKGSVAADSTANSDPAVKAATVANAIATKPASADSILKANGYTRESYEKELLDIAADSAMSARYAAAKSKP